MVCRIAPSCRRRQELPIPGGRRLERRPAETGRPGEHDVDHAAGGSESVRDVQQPERERVNRDRAKAREAYEGLTEPELGDRLAERGLPKTGSVDDLIDRLVEAYNK